MPGTERQPSSMSELPVASRISGFTSTTSESRRSETSTTMTCLATSTWIAARPIPGAVELRKGICIPGDTATASNAGQGELLYPLRRKRISDQDFIALFNECGG